MAQLFGPTLPATSYALGVDLVLHTMRPDDLVLDWMLATRTQRHHVQEASGGSGAVAENTGETLDRAVSARLVAFGQRLRDRSETAAVVDAVEVFFFFVFLIV